MTKQMTKLIQLNRWSLGANYKKDKIDSIESTKFRSKSQTHKIDSVDSMKLRIKSQKK
jgi:hypothetical protein